MNVTAYLLTAAAAAPTSADQQLLDIDGTLFITLGIFLVLLFALSRLLWKPYLRVRNERVSRVEGYKEEAAKMEADAEARLARCQADLAEARRVGSQELARARSQAQAREQEILSEAHSRAQKELLAARNRLEAALAAEKNKVLDRAHALGMEAAERMLGRKVSQ
jgi:F-type H+-transporting ATPase subunit b